LELIVFWPELEVKLNFLPEQNSQTLLAVKHVEMQHL